MEGGGARTLSTAGKRRSGSGLEPLGLSGPSTPTFLRHTTAGHMCLVHHPKAPMLSVWGK